MTAIIYADDYTSGDTLPDLVQKWFLPERPLFDIAEKNAAAALRIPAEPKGRYVFDGEWNSTQRFIRTDLMRDVITATNEGGKAIHAHFISKGYLPADFAYETGHGDFGKQFLTMELLIKAMRKHAPDVPPKEYKPFVAWLKTELLEAIGPQMEIAQTHLVTRMTDRITTREREGLEIWAETIPSIRELAKHHPQAMYDTHFTSQIRSILSKADNAAKRFGLVIDGDAFQTILYTPAFYLGFVAAYKPFAQRIMDNRAMEKLTEEAVQRGVGSYSLAAHPALALLNYTYPESKFDEAFHLHNRLMRGRINGLAKEHNISLSDQLVDAVLYTREHYRDFYIMSLMKPNSGYDVADGESFYIRLTDAAQKGIITATQAAYLEEQRRTDLAENKPFGAWEAYCKSIVNEGLVKGVKPIPAAAPAAPGRYARLTRVIEAARNMLPWNKGSSNNARPNP